MGCLLRGVVQGDYKGGDMRWIGRFMCFIGLYWLILVKDYAGAGVNILTFLLIAIIAVCSDWGWKDE